MKKDLKTTFEETHKKGLGFLKDISFYENKKIPKINIANTLVVASIDFSHFLPMSDAIPLEDCAAHAIMHNHLIPCSKGSKVRPQTKATRQGDQKCQFTE